MKVRLIMSCTLSVKMTSLVSYVFSMKEFLSNFFAYHNGGVFGVDGIAVFAYFDVGFSEISLK